MFQINSWKYWIVLTYWSSVMMSLLPVWASASRRAKSLASLPELTKKQTDKGCGKSFVNLWAHTTRLSWRNRILVDSRAICFWPARTTSGWQCPTIKYWIFIINPLAFNPVKRYCLKIHIIGIISIQSFCCILSLFWLNL